MNEPSSSSPRASPQPSSEKCLLFGIDFGTTYTGVAWAWSSQPEDIFTITNWKSQVYGNEEREKCPTSIYYGPDKTTWGYSTPLGVESIQWFKLLLVNEDDLADHLKDSPHLARTRQLLKGMRKTEVEIIGDYLKYLWDHVLENVRRSIGTRIMSKTPFHVELTIPAIWKPYAVAKMRLAATRAGILANRPCGQTTLSFITEPEAAALATLSDMRRRPDIEVGDAFIVADCGGGTVDLISYEVTKTQPIEMKECVEGTGALCGGAFLDQDFEALLRMRIGKKIWDRIPRSEIEKMMYSTWEHGIKQQFDGQPRNWPVDLPYECAMAGQMPRIELKSGHIGEVFENIISQIEGLVSHQLRRIKERKAKEEQKKPPKYVILVGGFGRCRFLYERLSTLVGNQSEILQSSGTAPWTAVCRGAVLRAIISKGLLPHSLVQISSRVSRASFGKTVLRHWIDGEFLEEDKYYCDIEKAFFAERQMNWFLNRGDNTLEKEPVSLNYYAAYPEPKLPSLDHHASVSMKMYTCDKMVAPTRIDLNATTIKPLCDLLVRSPVPLSQMPSITSPSGEKIRKFQYTVKMISHGASVEFIVIFDGQRIASQHVDVLFDDPSAKLPERPISKMLAKRNSGLLRPSVESLRKQMKSPVFSIHDQMYNISEVSTQSESTG
ncbi:hypothetical protein F5Y19DRAFT_416205 [Xylariaceae sp. FL1651]|nr:hypothetical protein F5Y19DRAFT_416205 [Xylariaceae sp. FL1651]